METERHLRRLLLDGAEIKVRRRRDAAFSQLQHVVDGLHLAAAENFSRREFGRQDRSDKFLEKRPPFRRQPIENVRHENRHQPRQRDPVIDLHLLEIGVLLPQRIGRLDERGAKSTAEDGLDLSGGGGDDRHFRHRAWPHDHRLADDADAQGLQRTGGTGRLRVTGVRRVQN